VGVQRLVKEFAFVRGNFLILLASWTLMNFASAIPETYYSLYVLALGGSEVVIGIIGFASFLVLALIQFPGGYLADKHGRRWLIVALTFGVAVSYLIYAAAPSWHLVLLAGILSNLCHLYQPALGAITADSIPPEKRGVGFSLQTLLPAVARLPGPVIAGALYVCLGLVLAMRVSYVLTFSLFFLAAILRLRLQETLNDAASRPDLFTILGSYPKAVKESVGMWKTLPKSMLHFFLISSLIQFFAALCSPYFVVYATKILAMGGFQWALLMSLLFASRMLSALPSGKIIDKLGRTKPFAFSQLLFLPVLLLFVYGDFSRLFLALLLFGVGESMLTISQQSLQADLAPRAHRGKVIGSMQFAMYLLVAMGQLLGGLLYRYVSPETPFLVFAASTVPLALTTALFIHDPKEREE
jgi:MFS family permease